jgi:hypothetical protein
MKGERGHNPNYIFGLNQEIWEYLLNINVYKIYKYK